MWLNSKESTCQCRRHKRQGFDLWVRKILWRKKWQSTPVFLPRESHGQRNLAGYSLRGHKKLDMTEYTHTHIDGQSLSRDQLFVIPWTAVYPAPLSFTIS